MQPRGTWEDVMSWKLERDIADAVEATAMSEAILLWRRGLGCLPMVFNFFSMSCKLLRGCVALLTVCA
jgi:hypothetical protein